MGELPNRLLQEALNLSADERAALAAALIDTLDEPADKDVEAAWAAEVERRIADIDAGVVEPVPWPEARAAIMRR